MNKMYVKENLIAVFDHHGHDALSRGQVQNDGSHVLLTAPFPELGVVRCWSLDSMIDFNLSVRFGNRAF